MRARFKSRRSNREWDVRFLLSSGKENDLAAVKYAFDHNAKIIGYVSEETATDEIQEVKQ